MALKIIMSAVLIAVCALTGRQTAIQHMYRADEVRRMQEDMKKLKTRTMDKKLPAGQALSDLEGRVYKRMKERMEKDNALSMKDAFLTEGGEGETFSGESACISLLLGALENLRSHDQALEYERVLKDLERMEDERRKEGKEKLRLFTSLGVLTGIGIVIFTL